MGQLKCSLSDLKIPKRLEMLFWPVPVPAHYRLPVRSLRDCAGTANRCLSEPAYILPFCLRESRLMSMHSFHLWKVPGPVPSLTSPVLLHLFKCTECRAVRPLSLPWVVSVVYASTNHISLWHTSTLTFCLRMNRSTGDRPLFNPGQD